MRLILLFFISFFTFNLKAQVGVNTTSPNASSLLDISSTSKGFLYPKLTTTQMNAIASPATGLIIYNTDATALFVYNGSAWNMLEDKSTAIVDDGVAVQIDNIKIQLSTNTSERSLQIATTTGTIALSGSSLNIFTASAISAGGAAANFTSWVRQSSSISTTFTTFEPGLNFTQHGSCQLIQIMDETNSRAYNIIFILGNSFKGNLISIKRIK